MEDDNYEPSTWGWVADHVERYLAPDDEGFDMQGAPCILLTTTGRRTGKTRISPLIKVHDGNNYLLCLLYTSPSPRDRTRSRMPSSA